MLFVPNSFTPNRDGKNDIFYAVASDMTLFHMQIFNRWGELIFESHDINYGWDGRYGGNLVQEDTYVVKLVYTSNCVGVEVVELRHVNVLR